MRDKRVNKKIRFSWRILNKRNRSDFFIDIHNKRA